MSDIVRWEPLREMMTLREAMDRLFEDSVVGPRWPGFAPDRNGGTLAVDMVESENEVIVTASVPGIKPEEIDISITGDVLTIKGETKSEQKIEKANYIRQERRYGAFERSLTLPAEVVSDEAKAVFENGVLTLALPKAEEVKPRSIKINIK